MEKGNLFKEKLEYAKERFRTKTGLTDFFIGSAIWGFIVVSYTDQIFGYMMELFAGVGNEIIQYYLAYLGISLIYTCLGLVISYAISMAFNRSG